MKEGDILVCCNEEDLQRTMQNLSYAGFRAVRESGRNFNLRITGVPKISYVVKARAGRSARAAYYDTLEEAEAAAAEWLGQGYEFVEILKGYPGEWETISQSW